MTTEVDIANLALSHLGDSSTVAALDPPDGSAQAVHLARFYPLARDALQEAYPWNFCVRRITPAIMTSETTAYAYAYQLPNEAVNIFSVLPPNADDDYVSQWNEPALTSAIPELGTQGSTRVPQNYAMETLADGQKVIYTDVQNAVIRYGIRETDTAKFTTLFTMGLARLLASYCAGPVIKGKAGREEAKFQFQMFRAEVGLAQVADANQNKQYLKHVPSWMANR